MGKATKGNVYPLWLLTKEHMGSIPTKAGLYTVIALSESFVVGSISAQMLHTYSTVRRHCDDDHEYIIDLANL
jgi:hypothetical protein